MHVMGRRIPNDNLSIIYHPVIYLSFFAAGFAASMAIITALCSVRFGRKTSPPPPSSDPIEMSKELDTSPTLNAENDENDTNNNNINDNDNNNNENNTNNDNNEKELLPLPPALQQHPKDPFISERMKRVTSERKAPLSLSIKMPRSLSVARNWDQKEEKTKGPKLKAEDSVWMKTIILGEKCVPDEEDDPVIFEGRGKKIAAYHTKRYSAMSISRQTSSLDPDVLPSSIPNTQTQNETEDETISKP